MIIFIQLWKALKKEIKIKINIKKIKNKGFDKDDEEGDEGIRNDSSQSVWLLSIWIAFVIIYWVEVRTKRFRPTGRLK